MQIIISCNKSVRPQSVWLVVSKLVIRESNGLENFVEALSDFDLVTILPITNAISAQFKLNTQLTPLLHCRHSEELLNEVWTFHCASARTCQWGRLTEVSNHQNDQNWRSNRSPNPHQNQNQQNFVEFVPIKTCLNVAICLLSITEVFKMQSPDTSGNCARYILQVRLSWTGI